MTYNFFNISHRVILSFLILILIAGCGYKGPPVYEPEVNATVEVKATHTKGDK